MNKADTMFRRNAMPQQSTQAMNADRAIRRDGMLIYGFVVSIIGVPIGIFLRLPTVWTLAILGIVIGGIKIVLRRSNKPVF